jgi:hypothetical protein
MLKAISGLLGVGLIILWIVGLAQHATPWLTWLDVVGALFSLAIAAGAGPAVERAFRAGAPIALGVGLAILWIIALATHATAWLSWWTFGFACAFIILGIVGGVVGERMARPHFAQRHPA